jgi:hypothetical protein
LPGDAVEEAPKAGEELAALDSAEASAVAGASPDNPTVLFSPPGAAAARTDSNMASMSGVLPG